MIIKALKPLVIFGMQIARNDFMEFAGPAKAHRNSWSTVGAAPCWFW
jgi:hypothetical protein